MTQLRMRIFAGPNGSGKSTVIRSVRETKVGDRNIDFGYYINADDIASLLRETGRFSFSDFGIRVARSEFIAIAQASGLLSQNELARHFLDIFSFRSNNVLIADRKYIEQLAQIIADFLRKKLLEERRRFSFETVFSHDSKLEIIRQANAVGYKVYFYFVSTEDVEINKFRVHSRVEKGGHAVPEHKIESRYFRAMDLMYDAAQLVYQAFFFDNSQAGAPPGLFAHFKMINGEKDWDTNPDAYIPIWFESYYSDKIK